MIARDVRGDSSPSIAQYIPLDIDDKSTSLLLSPSSHSFSASSDSSTILNKLNDAQSL